MSQINGMFRGRRTMADDRWPMAEEKASEFGRLCGLFLASNRSFGQRPTIIGLPAEALA
jgi:hypothetical protein